MFDFVFENLHWFLGSAFILLIAAFCVRPRGPAYIVRPLFSNAEIHFFSVLHRQLCNYPKIHLFAKVRLADLIQPHQRITNKKAWWKTFAAISQKHVDFVVWRHDTQQVTCVLELDDSSHKKRDRSARDAFVNKALQEAGISILHIPVQSAYSRQQIDSILTFCQEGTSYDGFY